ncbi:protein sidekick-1-like isoform X1 [Mirounga leonina]|uniref:protein sidekick-1-like isoform X1 n=1 Tax=Mirounga leonina TaxID=9715 RepID=UPI00156C3039|nr:protein sidekick-1-like isoform X1 [Mirounga leonina]
MRTPDRHRLAGSSPSTFTTVEVGATVRQFTGTELAPESAYIFRLPAKTRQGWSSRWRAPSSPLRREPPRDESLNSLLQEYQIYYWELESEVSSATVSKMLKTASALQAELPEMWPCLLTNILCWHIKMPYASQCPYISEPKL